MPSAMIYFVKNDTRFTAIIVILPALIPFGIFRAISSVCDHAVPCYFFSFATTTWPRRRGQ